jgi:ABC-type branched-subunit amino acid transport system substrate-binding protein
VDDDTFDAWYAEVSSLPRDLAWRQAYTQRFGLAPTDYADLYYDAATLLLADLRQVSRKHGGKLVIDRSTLAETVRGTTGFPGVTCTITLDPATGNRVDDEASLGRCAAG